MWFLRGRVVALEGYSVVGECGNRINYNNVRFDVVMIASKVVGLKLKTNKVHVR